MNEGQGRNGEKYTTHKTSASGVPSKIQQQLYHLQSPDRYSQCCRGPQHSATLAIICCC